MKKFRAQLLSTFLNPPFLNKKLQPHVTETLIKCTALGMCQLRMLSREN